MLKYYFVAFIDILGFAEMVASDCHSGNDGKKFFPVLHAAMLNTSKSIEQLENSSVRQFSDSIIISLPFSNSLEKYSKFASEVRLLQRRLFDDGILSRGGIAHGKHFEDKDFVFSQAVVSAYRIESQLASYPRVLISDDIIELFGFSLPFYCKDRDGQFFLDFLHEGDATDIANSIISLSKSSKHPRVAEKMRWLGDYASTKHPSIRDRFNDRIEIDL